MISKMYKTMAAAAVAIATVCWVPQATKAAVALYDDFSADLIDGTKWDRLELVRRVENGVFKSELTRFGSNGTNLLNFADTAAVNAYQADVTVTALSNTAASASGLWAISITTAPPEAERQARSSRVSKFAPAAAA